MTIESQFKPRDFEFILTDGTVSRVTKTAGENTSAWVQHTASINSGNSGGPLMLENGTVIGINTSVAKTNGVLDGSAFFSITLPQLKKEIEGHVRNIAWE